MQRVKQLKDQALRLMSSGGFPIREDLSIAIDERLPFMGYASERNGKPLIVVSKWGLSTDMAMGLVIHELSHVYRIETNHPSHNFSLHNEILKGVLQGKRIYSYQEDLIRNAINNIQDLYADDISFTVYIKKTHPKNLNEFFLGWIHTLISNPTSIKDTWTNAGSLLNTAFAQANLERHHVEDREGKVEKAVKEFLARMDKKVAQKFDYFKKIMVNLPEKISDKEFEKSLTTYITEFLKLTEISA